MNHYEQDYDEALTWMLNDKGFVFQKEKDQFTNLIWSFI